MSARRPALRRALLLAAFLLAPLSAPGSASANPSDCLGYPEPRVFLESQSWWYDTRTQTDGQSSHAHSGACFPLNRVVSGTLRLDVRTLIHNEPAGTRVSAIRIYAVTKGNTQQLAKVENPRGQSCLSVDCTFWNGFDMDLRNLARSGATEFRIQSETTRPDGARQIATTGWHAFVENSAPRGGGSAVRWPHTEGRGWYRKANGQELGYENAVLTSHVPSGPVCGRWRVEIETKAGSGGETPTATRVLLDPALHATPENPGKILYEASGPQLKELTIDTGLLANGPHKLAIVSKADENVDERLAGVQVIPFTVDNTLACSPLATVEPMLPNNAVISGDAGTTTDAILDAFADRASRVEYWIDGRRFAYDSSGPNFDEYLDPNALPDGTHTLVCKATIDGKVVESQPITFVIDN